VGGNGEGGAGTFHQTHAGEQPILIRWATLVVREGHTMNSSARPGDSHIWPYVQQNCGVRWGSVCT